MAFLINNETGEKIEVEENDKEKTAEAAEKIGVPIACTDGLCGSCRVKVVEGKENLTPLTQNEKDMDIKEDGDMRLICQCGIKKDSVKIDFENFY